MYPGFGCTEATVPGWNPSFRVHGQVCHLIGSLMPLPGEVPKFLQVYFIDNQVEETSMRMSIAGGLKRNIVQELSTMFHNENQYVQQLKTAHEHLLNNNTNEGWKVVIYEEKRPRTEHARRFNRPSSDEIGILMPNEPTDNRDIVLHYRDGHLDRVSELHRAYDALQYPLLFPYGTEGYHIYLRRRNGKKVSQMDYYSFHIMIRHDNYLLKARRLFQQFLVDSYCKIETERLQFIRREQRSLRADCYQHLRDALLHDDGDPRNVGQRVILPSTFTGGPRYMHERQMDAMTYVRKFGRPDLFLTMTTNPKWDEITTNLLPGQEAHDRPDLIARVFQLKLKKLMEFLKKWCSKELKQSHHGLHSQSTLHLTRLIHLPVLYFTWICHASIPGTKAENAGVDANVGRKWHKRRASLKHRQLGGFILSVLDKGSATIFECCYMKYVELHRLMI